MGNFIKDAWVSFKTDPNRDLNLYMLYICFGYYYKVLLLPIRFISLKLVYFVDVNHWIELFFYCPILFFSLYMVNQIIFRESKNQHGEEYHSFAHKTRKAIGLIAIGINFYGMGIHASANPIEIYTREHTDIDLESNQYKLIHLLDEDVSHWIQFIPFFFAIGWFVIQDKTGRFAGPYMSVFMGVGHGVDRAIGVIEGNSWWMGVPMSVWLLICCYLRYRKYGKSFAKCIEDYFFRHGLAIGVTIPSCQLLYVILFGGFVQPSEYRAAYYYQAIYTFAGTFVLLIVDRIRKRIWGSAPQNQFYSLEASSDVDVESTIDNDNL